MLLLVWRSKKTAFNFPGIIGLEGSWTVLNGWKKETHFVNNFLIGYITHLCVLFLLQKNFEVQETENAKKDSLGRNAFSKVQDEASSNRRFIFLRYCPVVSQTKVEQVTAYFKQFNNLCHIFAISIHRHDATLPQRWQSTHSRTNRCAIGYRVVRLYYALQVPYELQRMLETLRLPYKPGVRNLFETTNLV